MIHPIAVTRLNHLVLKVRNLQRSVDFYRDLFGFTEDVERYGPAMAFLRAPGSSNHHDLALLEVGPDAPDVPDGAVGLFHFALEVATLGELAAARDRLLAAGLLDREFDHGATRSVYGWDPDGHNFEIVWVLPRQDWDEWETRAPDRLPLDLSADLVRYA